MYDYHRNVLIVFANGHSTNICRSKSRCGSCLGNHPSDACDQNNPTRCIHCEGPHTTFSTNCPSYQKEKKIKKIMAYDNVSYIHAKKMVTENITSEAYTYANISATNHQTSPTRKRYKTNHYSSASFPSLHETLFFPSGKPIGYDHTRDRTGGSFHGREYKQTTPNRSQPTEASNCDEFNEKIKKARITAAEKKKTDGTTDKSNEQPKIQNDITVHPLNTNKQNKNTITKNETIRRGSTTSIKSNTNKTTATNK